MLNTTLVKSPAMAEIAINYAGMISLIVAIVLVLVLIFNLEKMKVLKTSFLQMK